MRVRSLLSWSAPIHTACFIGAVSGSVRCRWNANVWYQSPGTAQSGPRASACRQGCMPTSCLNWLDPSRPGLVTEMIGTYIHQCPVNHSKSYGYHCWLWLYDLERVQAGLAPGSASDAVNSVCEVQPSIPATIGPHTRQSSRSVTPAVQTCELTRCC